MEHTGGFGSVIINGEVMASADARISIYDIGLLRGYGCFEVVRCYGGRVFRMAGHIDRLTRSAGRLAIPLPPRKDIEAWVGDRAAAAGDCLVRVVVTGGVDLNCPGSRTRVIVYAEPVPTSSGPLRVLPLDAPWHPDAMLSELAGAKTLSYAPNVSATLTARRAGFDDALLIGRSGLVLEGPMFGVAWITEGQVETPGLELGILESITRAAVLDVARSEGVTVVEGMFDLTRLLAADEVFAMSTVREVTAIFAVAETYFEPGPTTARLAAGFRRLVADEISAS